MVALKGIRASVLKNMQYAAGGRCTSERRASRRVGRRRTADLHRKMRKRRMFPTAYFLKNLRIRLRGSTMIETMIASIIFLCVFAISLETISRLTVKKNDNTILVEVDYRIKQCRGEFMTGGFELGTYLREYQWGSIVINLKSYRHYENLRELTITADIKNNAKRLEYKYIFEPGDGA